jgi:hypothetical protein
VSKDSLVEITNKNRQKISRKNTRISFNSLAGISQLSKMNTPQK